MPTKTPSEKTLADYEREHRQLAKRLSRIGFLCSGSLSRRYLTCGNPGCACQRDPAARHGPYFYWSTKKAGKTISRKLPPHEAQILETWIANRRELNAILEAMIAVSGNALPLLLSEKATSRDPKSRP
jgi:hypothetical protein